MVKNEPSPVIDPTAVSPAVKSAVEAARARDAKLAEERAAQEALFLELGKLVGKTIVPKDGKTGVRGTITHFYGRFAFGHRVAPAYRIDSVPHHAIPVIVACDELEAGYTVEG